MNAEQTRELMPILTALAEGKQIQARRKHHIRRGDNAWFNVTSIRFQNTHDFRIKPLLQAGVDAYADLRRAAQNGATIQLLCKHTRGQWQDLPGVPKFICSDPNKQYRVKFVAAAASDEALLLRGEAKLLFKQGKSVQVKCNHTGHVWKRVTEYGELSCPDGAEFRLEPVDVYADLRQAHKDGKKIQVQDANSGEWRDLLQPMFDSPVKYYRVKPAPVDPYAALRQAKAEGKIIQFNLGTRENPSWTRGSVDDEYTFTFPPEEYRIKPEPVLRPWRLAEVPVGKLLREKGFPPVFLIVGANDIELACPVLNDKNRCIKFDVVLKDYEHSVDGGKTWQPCGVEATEPAPLTVGSVVNGAQPEPKGGCR